MTLPPRVSDLIPFDLLLSVARLGSLGRAAAEHGMSQPAHPWARRRSGITAAELAGTALVTREAASGTRRFFEQALEDQARLTSVPPLAELSSTTAIKFAVAAGAGPAVLSSLAVAGELTAGTLRAVLVRGLGLHRALRAVWPTGRRLTGPTQDLYLIATRSVRPGSAWKDPAPAAHQIG